MVKSKAGIMPKIFAYMMVFCLLLLVVLWLFQTVFLESFYKSIKQSDVRTAVEEIATAVENGENWQDSVVYRGDLYVELYTPGKGGETVPGNRPEGMFQSPNTMEKEALYLEAKQDGGTVRRESRSLLPPKPGKEGTFGPMPEQRESLLFGTVVQDGGTERLLIVSAEITPVSATVDTLRIQLVYISIFVLMLGLFLAWFIARRVAKPLQKLDKAAARLADNDYSVTFEAGGYSEAAQLADTLNHAAGELGKTEALRRELIANVGHDLRTPLTLITGYAEMMRDIPAENNPENMQVLIDEAARLRGLVNDMMEFSRLQSGTGDIQLETVDLATETQGIVERLGRMAATEGFEVEFNNTGPALVSADPARIAQVVYNFLTNAMGHAGGDKHITVALLHEAGGRVRLEVSDNGPGIPAKDLPNIWERYYKGDAAHSRAPGGSGLGLSIARSVLQQHPGAKYGVRSQAGEGSTFWFSLPLLEK